jgi:hypothetical protein
MKHVRALVAQWFQLDVDVPDRASEEDMREALLEAMGEANFSFREICLWNDEQGRFVPLGDENAEDLKQTKNLLALMQEHGAKTVGEALAKAGIRQKKSRRK